MQSRKFYPVSKILEQTFLVADFYCQNLISFRCQTQALETIFKKFSNVLIVSMF